MDELKDIIEKLGKAFEAYKKTNDERIAQIAAQGHADPLVTEKLEKINAELSSLSAMKQTVEALDKAAGRGILPGGGTVDGEKKQQLEALKTFMRSGAEGVRRTFSDSASTLVDPDGGFTVPEFLEQEIDRVAQANSAMRQICRIITIGTNEYKKLVGQGGLTGGWVSEKGSRTESTTPTLAEVSIPVHEMYTYPYATQTLLDDSAIDIAMWFSDEAGIYFSGLEGTAFISGDGVSAPKGINSYTKVANASYAWGKIGYTLSGNASLLDDPDKLIDVQHALKPVYRNNARWLMNDSTLGVVRTFKDGTGNYIWRPGLEEARPDTLLGKPISIDDNVPDIGAGLYAIFYGDFRRGYTIIDRIGIRVLRDPFSAKPYIQFYTTKRVGGGITNYEAIKTLKIAAA